MLSILKGKKLCICIGMLLFVSGEVVYGTLISERPMRGKLLDGKYATLKFKQDTLNPVAEDFHWKKEYPVEDFLKLREYVQKMGDLLVITIDSVTAVKQLKINPRAYRDLKNNVRDCNKVSAYAKDDSILRQYVRKYEDRMIIAIDSITVVDSLKLLPQVYRDLKKEIENRNSILNTTGIH